MNYEHVLPLLSGGKLANSKGKDIYLSNRTETILHFVYIRKSMSIFWVEVKQGKYAQADTEIAA